MGTFLPPEPGTFVKTIDDTPRTAAPNDDCRIEENGEIVVACAFRRGLSCKNHECFVAGRSFIWLDQSAYIDYLAHRLRRAS